MNIEKEVTITDLKAKFTKDLDSLSKMVRRSQCRTLSSNSAWARA
jgi:hypothetical protein